MRRFHRARRACIAVPRPLLALGLGALLAGPAFAAEPVPPVSPTLRFALQRDLGIMPGQIPQYQHAERRGIDADAKARKALGDAFAGSWLERNALGEFVPVVAASRPSALPAARGLGTETRLVDYSLVQLRQTVSRLDGAYRAQNAQDLRIHGWAIDVRGNRVIVTVDPGAQQVAAELLARSGADASTVRVRTASHRPRPNANNLYPGNGYYMRKGSCSVGYPVTWADGSGFATVGHCGASGTRVTVGPTLSDFGAIIASFFPIGDQGLVRNDDTRYWVVPPLVDMHNDYSTQVIGNIEIPVGGAVCSSGVVSGWQCGTIDARDVRVNYPQGMVYDMVLSSQCTYPGDSGGPVISSGHEAQSLISGSMLRDAIGCGQTVSQPIQPLLNRYRLVLTTIETCGRMNPGRVLPNGGAITSCDGRFTLVIQSDGHLVLYQAGVGAIWYNQVFGSGHTLHMQSDGNLVVYNGAAQPVWYTATGNQSGAFLRVQDDGNVVLYTYKGQALWESRTGGR